MKIDLTITLSIIIIFVTAISPIITMLISNHHQIKIKSIEYNQTLKQEVLNQFIKVTININNYSINTFYEELNKVLLFVDDSSSKKLGKIKYLVETDKNNIKGINSAVMDFILCVNKIK